MKNYLTVFLFGLLVANCNVNETEKDFYKNLLSDGNLTVAWEEAPLVKGESPVRVVMDFTFKNNKITQFSCLENYNPSKRYRHLSYQGTNMDTRFKIIDEVGSNLVLKTPLNEGSYGGKDWDITLKIDIDNLELFHGSNRGKSDKALNGTATIIQLTGLEQQESTSTFDATFYAELNNGTQSKPLIVNSVEDSIAQENANKGSEKLMSRYKDSPKNQTSSDKNNTEEPLISFIGTWKGTIGKKDLTIVFESVKGDSIWGYDVVEKNKRSVKGTSMADDDVYTFELHEPGDDKWDGVFVIRVENDFKYNGNGEWKANNGKLNHPVSIKLQK